MYKYNDISYEQIFEYIDNFNTKDDIIFSNFRKQAELDNIPIIKIDVENYLKNMICILKPKKILELGCAVGYSSIIMSKILDNNVEIDTLEISIDMVEKAKENFKKLTLNNINVIYGDALNTLPSLSKKYDFVFIDAAKGHYDEFFNIIIDKLDKNSTIICDNILSKGFLCLDRLSVPRRQRTIYTRMTTFLEHIKNMKNISYNLLPLGDGLLVIHFN